MTGRVWRKAKRCGGGACIEALLEEVAVYVRDTSGAVVSFDPDAWQRFIAALKWGRL
jgi:hypothetical protein